MTETMVNPETMVPLAQMLLPDNKQLLQIFASPANPLLLAPLVHLDQRALLVMLVHLDNLLALPCLVNLDLLVLLALLEHLVAPEMLVPLGPLDKFKMSLALLAPLDLLALLDNPVNLDKLEQATLDKLDHLDLLAMLVPLVCLDTLEPQDNAVQMEIPEAVENAHTVLHQELLQVIKTIICFIFAFIYCHEKRKPFNNRKNLRSFCFV